jgi:formate/nitrite transporter FocA (FNT family)
VVALLMGTGIFSTAAAPLSVAVAKTSLTFSQALLRGIAGNWLVCMAVWQALGAQCFPGKFLACLLPVSAFVAMGLEHSVANMFVVPMGIALGAPVSMGHFITSNLIPVTIGNAIGGAVFVAVAFCAAFGKLGKGKAA